MVDIHYALFIMLKIDHVCAPKQEIIYKIQILPIKDTLYDVKE